MPDQKEVVDPIAVRTELRVLLEVLRQKGLLTDGEVNEIRISAEQRVKHGIEVTPPGATNESAAVLDLFARIDGLTRR